MIGYITRIDDQTLDGRLQQVNDLCKKYRCHYHKTKNLLAFEISVALQVALSIIIDGEYY